MELSRLFDYSDRCRTLEAQTLRSAPPELLHAPFETISPFNSVAKLLAHTIGAEERWLARVEARDGAAVPPSRYEERAPADLESLLADGQALRARTRAIADVLTPSGLAQEVTVAFGRADVPPVRLSVEEMLFQILHHEHWHRAQLSLLLQRAGIDPPFFDYVLLKP